MSSAAGEPTRSSPAPAINGRALPAKLFARWLGVALLAAGAFAAYRHFSAEPARPVAEGPGRGPATAVAATEVVRGSFPLVFSGLGTVTPSATSIVKAQVSGPLIEVKFTEGQAVKPGDVLAQIDPRPYELAVTQAEGQLQKDRALLENAERDLARYEALRRKIKDAISGQQIDTQRSLIGQYKAAVDIDRALVGQARLNLGYTRVAAPIEGRIGLRLVDPGNIVQTNDSGGLAVVTRLSPITVIFSLPEVKLQAVLRRFRSGEKLSVIAYDHEHASELACGKLYAIDNQIDATSGTVKLRAEFPNTDEKLYPNQFVNAELLVETLDNVVLTPAAAVQRGSRGPFVYTLKSDDTVVTKPVRLGPSDGDRVVIEEGLESGERVIIEGVDKLRDGAKVVLTRGPAAADPAARQGPHAGGQKGAGDEKRRRPDKTGP